jgi:acyl-CoA thioester hydrolase
VIYTDKQFVRWDDLDAMGHVNNAKYLTYIQETRFLWSPTAEMVVARAEVDYLEPIYQGGRYFDISLWVESIGNSSFTLAYEVIGDNGVVHARVKTVQVAVAMDSRKSRPLSDSERDFLSKYLKA